MVSSTFGHQFAGGPMAAHGCGHVTWFMKIPESWLADNQLISKLRVNQSTQGTCVVACKQTASPILDCTWLIKSVNAMLNSRAPTFPASHIDGDVDQHRLGTSRVLPQLSPTCFSSCPASDQTVLWYSLVTTIKVQQFTSQLFPPCARLSELWGCVLCWVCVHTCHNFFHHAASSSELWGCVLCWVCVHTSHNFFHHAASSSELWGCLQSMNLFTRLPDC